MLKETQIQPYIDNKLDAFKDRIEKLLPEQNEIIVSELRRLKTEISYKDATRNLESTEIKKLESEINEWTKKIEIQLNVKYYIK